MSQQIYRRKQLQLPETSAGDVANVCPFQSFVTAAAIFDHLLIGLIKDVFQLCFYFLKTDACRRNACMIICGYISTSFLPQIDQVLQWTTTGECIRHLNMFQTNNLISNTLFSLFMFDIHISLLPYFMVAASDEVKPSHLV